MAFHQIRLKPNPPSWRDFFWPDKCPSQVGSSAINSKSRLSIKNDSKLLPPSWRNFFWPEKPILQGGSSAINATSRHSIKMIRKCCPRHGGIFSGQRNAVPECGLPLNQGRRGSRISHKTNTNSPVALWKKFLGARHRVSGRRLSLVSECWRSGHFQSQDLDPKSNCP